MSLLLIFLDGVGVGPAGPMNPLSHPGLRSFSLFTGCEGVDSTSKEVINQEFLYKRLDANLSVEGLPQSGTGQTALFTGINASKVIGKHFGPYPHSALKPLLAEHSLFKKIQGKGKNPFFLNAYPDLFFKKSESLNRWSCTTLMTRSAGVPLNTITEVNKGEAITAEIVQSVWKNTLKLNVPEIEPEEASDRALNMLERYDLVLFEYYLTDKAGHSRQREMADRVLHILDRFLFKIVSEIKKCDTLVITSDHGNIENMDVKTHTRNPVPLFVKGDVSPFLNATSITDITPSIAEVLGMGE